MSLLDEARAQTRKPGTVCSVATIREALGDEAAELDAMLALPKEDLPTSAILRALRARKFVLVADSLGRHRRGECRCRS